MYFMYIDESGDVWLEKSPTRYFVLTGLVIHELAWQEALDQLVDFRRRMKERFGLLLREEIHAGAMLTHPGDLVRIKRHDRLAILRAFADELATMRGLNIINIVVDKENKAEGYDVFVAAWQALIQRFENTTARGNFEGPKNGIERGMLFPDHTDDKKLRQLVRKMRHYNPVPNQRSHGIGYRNLTIRTIVEDPNFRNSEDSYFLQAADLAAFLLYQHLAPNSYMRKKSAQNYFNRLKPIISTVVAPRDPQGIVRL